MALKLYTSLTLDLNDIATVWRARVEVWDTDHDDAPPVEEWTCPFAIDREAQAQEWIDGRVAVCRARYKELA